MDSTTTKLDYIEFAEVDDIWVRAYSVKKARTVIGQHVHVHDHITLVSSGSVRVWKDLEESQDFHAPAMIIVPAGSRHRFMALTDDVVLCCLHNLRDTGTVRTKISAEVAHAI